jgi:soluble lytic murein transglycosylase-like protein
MRSFLLASSVALALGISAGPAHSSIYKQADSYFTVRDRAQLVEQFTMEEVQGQSERFVGKLLEVKGAVSGRMEADSGVTVLIQPGPSAAPVEVSLPAGKTLEDWPFLDLGTSVRALCQVVTVANSTQRYLELVIAVKEYDAEQTDKVRRKKAADLAARQAAAKRAQQAKVARRTGGTRMASRGVSPGAYGSAQRLHRGEVLERYADAVRYFNRRLSPATARSIANMIIQYSERYGLDARLVMAVIAVESNFNQNAQSPVGAMGLGQLMPGTAGDLGVGNPWDPEQNLEGSTRLLSRHIRNMEDGRPTEEAIKLALACYNAGAGAVRKYKGIPPYRETQNYVKKITRLYLQMRGEWRG